MVKKPENSYSIYLNHSNIIHYDVGQDVCVTHLKHQFSQNSKSDNICSYDKKKETIAEKQSKNTCHKNQKQTKSMLTKENAKRQSAKTNLESEHTIMHPKKAKITDEVTLQPIWTSRI